MAAVASVLALAPSAEADHCVAYHDVNLHLLIDYSNSMAGLKHVMARDFALRVIDGLNATGHLRWAGGIGVGIFNVALSGYLFAVN